MSALLAAPLSGGVDAVAVNAASGDLGAIFAPLIQASTAASMPGATPEEIAAAVQTTVAAFRWGTEPGDPLYAEGAYSESLPTLLQRVSAGGEDVALHAKADQQRLAERFASVGADQAERVITYCGGGIAASNDAFALTLLGYDNVAIYDASLSEWAADESLPMEVG